jgi:hypothetical protein
MGEEKKGKEEKIPTEEEFKFFSKIQKRYQEIGKMDMKNLDSFIRETKSEIDRQIASTILLERTKGINMGFKVSLDEIKKYRNKKQNS